MILSLFKMVIHSILYFKVCNFFVGVVENSVSKVRLNNEKLLIKQLTENYPQKFGRPFINDSLGEPLVVKMRVQLIQIVKVDPNNQILQTNVWTNFVIFLA
jgi:hypothetical protein